MVKLKYRKYNFVSNQRVYNILQCGTKVDFADTIFENQISLNL